MENLIKLFESRGVEIDVESKLYEIDHDGQKFCVALVDVDGYPTPRYYVNGYLVAEDYIKERLKDLNS